MIKGGESGLTSQYVKCPSLNMFSTARCAHDIYIRALRHVSKKCHICKKKKDDKGVLHFPFPHILSWCSPPASAASHFQKIQNSLKYGAHDKKVWKVRIKRKERKSQKMEPNNLKQNEEKIWKQMGKSGSSEAFYLFSPTT